MFNLWDRTYVQTFNQRNIFDSKTILADSNWARVVFGPESFRGGELIAQEWDLTDVLDKHYGGQLGSMFVELMSDRASKWSIVVNPRDYYKLLAHYLKELQYTYKFSDEDLHTLAFSFMYNNFYYSGDTEFVDGFVAKTYQDIMKRVFEEYTPVGILDLLDPSSLPTEITYFLLERDIIAEEVVIPKLKNAAKMVISRLWSVHNNDFSEWLILDTQHFLNLMKSPETAEVTTADFAFTDMFNMINVDPYLNSMFFSKFPFTTSVGDWDSDPNFKVTASRLIGAWEGLADYLVQRGIDQQWAEVRHSQYAEIILRYEYVKSTCAAVKYILQLDGAPETLDKPVLDMLGYDILSECFDTKYNKTLMLITFRGMSTTFKGFAEDAFKDQDRQ